MSSTPAAPPAASSAPTEKCGGQAGSCEDYDDGGLAVVRVKPLGVGGGGVDVTDGTSAVEVSQRGVVVTAGSRMPKEFSYPRHVVPPGFDQAEVYETFMQVRIDAFLRGHNVNIMVYGQTGSGKTHTMFGPPGLMARAASGEFGVETHADYGLCPRGILNIIARVKALERSDTNTRYVLTASAVELTAYSGNNDMMMKTKRNAVTKFSMFTGSKGVVLDNSSKPPRLYGMAEVPLDKPDDAMDVFAAIAQRNTAGTGLNESSSRSHCFICLNLYALDMPTKSLRTSRFQFVDMAGSERLSEAHGTANWRDGVVGAMEGTMTNLSLILLSQCVRHLVEATAKKQKFSFRTYLVDLVMLLSESISGSALTLVIVCVSAATANASQTINALDFGEVFSRLTMRPEIVKSESLVKAWKRAESLIESGRKKVASAKFTTMREAQARDGEQLKQILLALAPPPEGFSM